MGIARSGNAANNGKWHEYDMWQQPSRIDNVMPAISGSSGCIDSISRDSGVGGASTRSNRRDKRDIILAVHRVSTNEIHMLPTIDANGEHAYDILLGYCVKVLGVRLRYIRHLSVSVDGSGSGVLIDSTLSMYMLSDMSIVNVSCYL